MVSRKRIWRIAALAVALATASHLSGALAQSDFAPVPPAAVPGGGQLMWGGRLPAPGEGYTPSAPRLGDQGYDALLEHSQAQQNAVQAAPPAPAAPSDDGWSLTEDLLGGGGAPAAVLPPPAPMQAETLPVAAEPAPLPPPLAAPVSIDGGFAPPAPAGDPWAGLKQVSPEALARAVPAPAPARSVVAPAA